tara:strand:- start:184 stop:384 length:201 start_codon:yes stop_codon:yes gene_type:complete
VREQQDHDANGRTPLFRITTTQAARLAFAEVTVEVEISIEDGQATAFNKSFALLVGSHCGLPDNDA